MKIIVIGAGVSGVLSAYFLALKGHRVTVLEKNSKAAMGCSYANGGQLSFSHVEPFSSKASFYLILKSLFQSNSFLSIENKFEKRNWRLFYDFLKNCGDSRAKNISRKLFKLGQESRLAFSEVMNNENIDFEYKNEGILHFFKNKRLFEKAKNQAQFQESLGDEIEILTAQECLRREPTLARIDDEGKLLGGTFHKNDASGNACTFVQKLSEICEQKYGVEFVYDCEVKNILTNRKKVTGINCGDDVYVADAYVGAFGGYGAGILEGIGVNCGVFGVKGYSLSIPCNEEFLAPKLSLTDPENKIVYSRLGDVFRAAGTVEISDGMAYNDKLLDFLRSKIRDNFSDFGNIEKAETWCGIRPFRASSIPLITKVERYGNLFLNMGHGHLGWTMSAGSGKILANLIEGRHSEKFVFLDEEI